MEREDRWSLNSIMRHWLIIMHTICISVTPGVVTLKITFDYGMTAFNVVTTLSVPVGMRIISFRVTVH